MKTRQSAYTTFNKISLESLCFYAECPVAIVMLSVYYSDGLLPIDNSKQNTTLSVTTKTWHSAINTFTEILTRCFVFLCWVLRCYCYAECLLCWRSLMLMVAYTELPLCWCSLLTVTYADGHLCWQLLMLMITADICLCWQSLMLTVTYADGRLCWWSLMLMVT